MLILRRMRMKRWLVAALTLLLVLSPLSALADYDMPYYIGVDITNQIVTIYRTADGAIVRQMASRTIRPWACSICPRSGATASAANGTTCRNSSATSNMPRA